MMAVMIKMMKLMRMMMIMLVTVMVTVSTRNHPVLMLECVSGTTQEQSSIRIV